MVDQPFVVSDGVFREMDHSICPEGFQLSGKGGKFTSVLDIKTEHGHEKIILSLQGSQKDLVCS